MLRLRAGFGRAIETFNLISQTEGNEARPVLPPIHGEHIELDVHAGYVRADEACLDIAGKR